ncbi:adenylyltransferase/cytidyltransferase family protein, partial [Candidatus Kaiserbacteria bacterium]|nr:adenylyltransferase/cytidyltransferase family protein [Candidatus Kaiserbacteria bacterium]
MKKPKWVAVSGGFDPLHVGHVRLFKAARRMGDKLVVILNNDNWLRSKKGFVFMPEIERAELMRAFPFVDKVVLTDHKKDDADRSVARTLAKVRPDVFANGGDRVAKNTPESNVCKRLGIRMVFNVGHGGKVQSSSWMIDAARKPASRTVRPWGMYYGWDSGKGWNLKTVYIHPRKRLSLQYHHGRSEHWMLVEGDATATIQQSSGLEERYPLRLGESFRVGQGTVHRLESKRGGIIVEVAL